MGVLMDNVRQGFNLLFTPVLYYGVVASIALQLSTWERGDRTQDKLQNQYANNGDKFDFIIVGGGLSGIVLANRLSQYYSILVLEAGGEPNPLQFVPGMARSVVNYPQVDWMHKTVAQKKSCGFAQYRRATWPSGKTLGGSGNLDFLMYLRGNPEDFDNWARITNDASWKYDNLLPHFQKAEDIVTNSTDPGAHRHGGELRIQKSEFLPLAKQFLEAAKELGYPNVDLNGHFTEGFDMVHSTIKKGEKQAPIRAFLDSIRKRKTLTIRKFAFVTKIKFRADDNLAYAVDYERHGDKFTAYANKEILLSAGAMGSPKLLMLSGIGPKTHLEGFGIKNIVNSPVGQNLQEHVATYLGPFFINEPLSFEKERDITAQSYVEYGTQGSGPLTSGGFGATGLVASSYAKFRGEEAWPDLQLTLYATSVDKSFATDMAHTYGLQIETLKKYYQHAIGKHSFHILTSLGRPASRGEIRLASRTAADPLIINPKYLEDQWNLDIKAIVDGLKKSMRLVEGSTVFQNIGGHFTSEVLPGCENTIKFRSDEYFECYARQYTVSMFNPVGTCAMGPVDSLFAVVDPKLRVIGTKHLRVIDSSVMPSIPVGGTQAATIAIAEKGAQMILSYWSNPVSDSLNQLHQVSNSIESSNSEPIPEIKKLHEIPILQQIQSTTSKSVMKSMSPFSVSIKTSSPTPFPAVIPSRSILTKVTTAAPPTTTTEHSTTTASSSRTTGIPFVSFPIISSVTKSKSVTKHAENKRPSSETKFTSVPKLNYVGVSAKPRYKKLRTTTEKNKIIRIPESVPETTTQNPFETLTSTYSIQAAEMTMNSDDSIPTTYRPEIMLIDPSKGQVDPRQQYHHHHHHQQSSQQQKPQFHQQEKQLQQQQQQQQFPESLSFGKSILYLVQKKEHQNTGNIQQQQTQLDIQPEYMSLPTITSHLEYENLPMSRLVPPDPSRKTYSNNYGTPTQPTSNSYPTTQFELHEIDEGFVNDRFARYDRNRFQQEQINLHQQNRHPIRVLRRHPQKTKAPSTQTQQTIRHFNQPKSHSSASHNPFQPANLLYHGTAESISNYQLSPLTAQESYPAISYFRRF